MVLPSNFKYGKKSIRTKQYQSTNNNYSIGEQQFFPYGFEHLTGMAQNQAKLVL